MLQIEYGGWVHSDYYYKPRRLGCVSVSSLVGFSLHKCAENFFLNCLVKRIPGLNRRGDSTINQLVIATMPLLLKAGMPILCNPLLNITIVRWRIEAGALFPLRLITPA